MGRLHQGEVQQHSLRSQLLQSKSQTERLSRELQEASQLRERVESLKDELGMMVPRGQFEAICKDFEASLKREKELKIYLSQHVSVVEQLQTKLQLAYQEVQCKETMLTKSNKVNDHVSYEVLYGRKYWRELNLAVGSQITIANVLADLNLAVRYGIAIRIYASKKFWRIIIWRLRRQTAKPPN